ncbi:N-acetylmuramoyl-L-alanine amidase [Clostridium folliculivorans]|uniref:N-acetylmuramoyl-L-alanine amidase n=1 Tax=Clostridium folliculivorans TaxID=2886038 RepID=UPI0021C44604|nr:N-acetylmuramoyl-L-alanine amidase [Clostridium folliculivorans]GKU31670.1 hypothetical protein CFB3_37770 [Clostridium folliculivorans]
MKKLLVFLLPLLICILGVKYVAKADELQGVKYSGHVQNVGWQGYSSNGADAGTSGKGLRLEAIKIELMNPSAGMNIKYQAHVQNLGWQNWVENGQVSGTTGSGLRVEAIRIQLENVPGYDIEYQAHVQDIGWQDWVGNGEIAGTTGRGLRIEAIRIRLVKNSLNLKYSTHIQNVGWQQQKNEGEVSGLPGQALRVESINIDSSNAPSDIKVTYQTHVQNVGWTNWVQGGQESGTTGKGLRIEGIRIKLTGNVGDYHVIYKTYVEGRGWQGWLSDGQISGYVGRNLRIEGLMIKVVRTRYLSQYIKPKVAIDIGHNNDYDSGATGIRQEDDMTMEVGSKVISKLTNLGYTVIDTLPSGATSVSDSLIQRSNYANENEVGRFVCVHFNVFNGQAHGSEVFYQTNSDISKNLAQTILNNLVSLGFTNRGIKTDNLSVLRNTTAPSVLIEGCFIDNANDMKRYDAEKMANAIVDGIVNNYH